MESPKLPEEIMERIDRIDRFHRWVVLQWWEVEGIYFVVAQKYVHSEICEVYCLMITPERLEISNILHF